MFLDPTPQAPKYGLWVVPLEPGIPASPLNPWIPGGPKERAGIIRKVKQEITENIFEDQEISNMELSI